jgi:hypothetical protein
VYSAKERSTPVFGFPKFWQKVYDANKPFFQEAWKLQDLAKQILDVAQKEAPGKPQFIVFMLVRITVIGLFELITLAGNGAGPGAMKISRGMFESAGMAEYLRQNPQDIQDFKEFLHIANWKRYQGLSSEDKSLIGPGRARELEEEYKRAVTRFTDKNGRVRERWHKKSIRQMAAEVGRLEQYELTYSYGASIHHSSAEGVLAYLEGKSGELILDAPPSMEWIPEALIAGHTYTLQALDTLNESLKLGFDEQIKSAAAAFKEVWSRKQ